MKKRAKLRRMNERNRLVVLPVKILFATFRIMPLWSGASECSSDAPITK